MITFLPRKAIQTSLIISFVLFFFGCQKAPEYTTRAPGQPAPPQRPVSEIPTQRPYVIKNVKYYPIPSAEGFVQTGIASWYGRYFHGRKTSNGERYNMYADTAAHKTLPMNTMVLVKNLENGREMVVRINDRGPFVRGRIIDLSYASAKKMGIIKNGTAKVRIHALAPKIHGSFATTPDFATGEFYVQIGSFLEKNNAERLRDRFRNAGHTTVIRKFSLRQRTYYRVQVYAGNKLDGARKAEADLLRRGYDGAFTVAR